MLFAGDLESTPRVSTTVGDGSGIEGETVNPGPTVFAFFLLSFVKSVFLG